MSDIDTSREAVEAHISSIPGYKPVKDVYELENKNAALLRALLSERDELQEKMDELSVSIADACAAGFEACREMAEDLASEYPVQKHGYLSTDPFEAGAMVKDEIASAIRALSPQQKDSSDE